MKICNVCETKVQNDINICPVCGNTFVESEINVKNEAIDRSVDKKRNIIPLIIFLTVLLLAVIIGLTCFFVFSSENKIISDEQSSNSLSETSHQSVVEITTMQNTTVEIILNEAYYIKFDKTKEYAAIYKEADIDSKIIKKFSLDGSKAVKVTAIREEGNFYYIKYENKSGYILKDYLTKLKQKATSAAAATTVQTTVNNNYTYKKTQQTALKAVSSVKKSEHLD